MNRARIFIKEKCMYHLGFYIKIVYHLARYILSFILNLVNKEETVGANLLFID